MDGEADQSVNERKRFFSFSRNNFYLLLIGCYLLPLFVIVGYALSFSDTGEARTLFIAALLSAFAGICGGLYLLRLFENRMQHSVAALVREKLAHLPTPQEENLLTSYQEKVRELHTYIEELRRGYEHQIDLLQSSTAKSKEKVEELNLEMDRKLEEMRSAYLEYEDVRKDYERLYEDYGRFRHDSREELKHKDSLLSEYQHTISEQRMILEKKQRYVGKLEGKVRDLMYEIRSLLQLEESPLSPTSPPLVELSDHESNSEEYYLPPTEKGPYDLSLLLSRYRERAEKFTGVDHLGYMGGKSPRFLDMSLDSYAIDLRRLFDTFRDETSGILFVYSQLEEKLLFVNNYIKTILGWSPEKFIKEFPELVETGHAELENALTQIHTIKESELSLTLRSKAGDNIPFHCFIGAIASGPFVNHVIGILSPIESA